MVSNGKVAANGSNNKALDTSSKPLFKIEEVQLQFTLSHSLQKLLVESNTMYLVLSKAIYKIDLDNPAQVKHVKVPNSLEKFTDSWLHPSGLHLIVQVNHSTYYYLNEYYQELKPLTRLKGLRINHIAFQFSKDFESTGDFLIATDDSLYIAFIKYHDPRIRENRKDDKYVKQVFRKMLKIEALSFNNDDSQIVLVADNFLYIWNILDLTYSGLTKIFKTDPNAMALSLADGPLTFTSNGDSYFLISLKNQEIVTNDVEIQLSQSEKLDSSEAMSDKVVVSEHHILALNEQKNKLLVVNKLSKEETVLSLNDFLGYTSAVRGIAADYVANTFWIYADTSIFEVIIENESTTVWYNYYKMGKYDEALKNLDDGEHIPEREMVRIKQGYHLLQEGGLGMHDDQVSEESLELQTRGIRILANTAEPFEKVVLMLLNLQDDDLNHQIVQIPETLLIEYLMVKFKVAKEVEKNKTRVIILSSWIIESMLRVTCHLERGLKDDLSKLNSLIQKSKFTEMSEKLDNFIKLNYKLLDKKTVYQLFSELNAFGKLLNYAELIGDYDFILDHYIDLEKWADALKTLTHIYVKKPSSDTIYSRATVMLVNYPKATVETFLRFDNLDYVRLLPALLTYNKKNLNIPVSDNSSIRFLMKLINEKGVRNRHVINCYLSLLLTYPANNEESQDMITRFINQLFNTLKLESSKSDMYDADFVLRLCVRNNYLGPAISVLINNMGQFEHALKIAMDNDLPKLGESILMKYLGIHEKNNEIDDTSSDSYVRRINLDEETFGREKRLWLMFAQYLIAGACNGKTFDSLLGEKREEKIETNDATSSVLDKVSVKSVTEEIAGFGTETGKTDNTPYELNRVLKYLLGMSDENFLVLKDLLPLFPETVNINNFKHEIVKSLNKYNDRIAQLSSEMNESLQISNDLKTQINKSNQIGEKGKLLSIIEAGESCRLCNKLLVTKSFVCFPNCQHNFHKDCMIKYFLRHNYRFQGIFETFRKNPSALNKNELDDILLKECVLCNEANISTIDDNLIDYKTDKIELKEWNL